MPKVCFIQMLALVLIGCVLVPATARAQAACDDVLLDKADRFYVLGYFEEATSALKPCLPGRIRLGEQHFRRRAQATRALRLMALSHFALRASPDSTREWVRKLVKLDRGYRADPDEDPLFFQNLVDELRPARWYQRWWVQVGGALVVGGIVSYVLFKPGPEVLPGPEKIFTPPPGN